MAFVCFKYSKHFISRGGLNSHLWTYEITRLFQCGECKLVFTTAGSVRWHMAVHQEERPFMCPCCEKTFKTISRIFLNENFRSFMQVCDQIIKGKLKLSNHITAAHPGINGKLCEFVAKVFTLKWKVKKCMKLARERNLHCLYCPNNSLGGMCLLFT